MGRRLALLGIGVALAAVTTACPGDVSATPPPVISSIAASPSPAVAGGPLSIEVHASHLDGIFEAHVIALTRADGFLPSQHQCANAGAQPPAGSGVAAVVTITCTLPASIQNTVWTARVNVTSNAGTTAFSDVPFAVTGGSDDYAGPTITPVGSLPTSIELGATFGFTVLLTDEHPPFSGLGALVLREGATFGEATIECAPGAPVPLSPTTAEVTFTCTSTAAVVPGTHHVNLWGSDDLGQPGVLAFDLSAA